MHTYKHIHALDVTHHDGVMLYKGRLVLGYGSKCPMVGSLSSSEKKSCKRAKASWRLNSYIQTHADGIEIICK